MPRCGEEKPDGVRLLALDGDGGGTNRLIDADESGRGIQDKGIRRIVAGLPCLAVISRSHWSDAGHFPNGMVPKFGTRANSFTLSVSKDIL